MVRANQDAPRSRVARDESEYQGDFSVRPRPSGLTSSFGSHFTQNPVQGMKTNLSLKIIARDNVSNSAQRWGLNSRGSVDQQLDQTLADSSFDDGLNLVILAVREVAQRPTSVSQHLVYPREAGKKIMKRAQDFDAQFVLSTLV